MEKVSLIQKNLKNSQALLVSSETNQLYFTRFPYSDGYLFITSEKAYLITDFRYFEAAKAKCGEVFEVVMDTDGVKHALKEIASGENVKEIFFEDKTMSVDLYAQMCRLLDFAVLKPAGGMINDLRISKDEYELECIKKAQSIAERSLSLLLGTITTDKTETELAAELEYLMKRNGSENPAFHTICISGKSTSLPHGVPQNKKIEKGFLTFDFGAIYNGYLSDMTRTFCTGTPTNEMEKVYSTVLKAQLKALDALEKGERNCKKIDAAARDIIENAGYKKAFGHSLGHGVGLEIHEEPRLSPFSKECDFLKEGNIVTVEPGIYLEGEYGVRIEDMIYVNKSGIEDLTHFEKKLIII